MTAKGVELFEIFEKFIMDGVSFHVVPVRIFNSASAGVAA